MQCNKSNHCSEIYCIDSIKLLEAYFPKIILRVGLIQRERLIKGILNRITLLEDYHVVTKAKEYEIFFIRSL